MAAQTARDRKKARMTELEEIVAQLEQEVTLIILTNVFPQLLFNSDRELIPVSLNYFERTFSSRYVDDKESRKKRHLISLAQAYLKFSKISAKFLNVFRFP